MKTQIKQIDTKELFGTKDKVIEIVHNETIYYLKITKENKLILTK